MCVCVCVCVCVFVEGIGHHTNAHIHTPTHSFINTESTTHPSHPSHPHTLTSPHANDDECKNEENDDYDDHHCSHGDINDETSLGSVCKG